MKTKTPQTRTRSSTSAIAAGADSLMIEVHPNPAKALSDGPQSLTLEGFEQLMQAMAPLGKFFGRWTQTPVTASQKFAQTGDLTLSAH